MALYAFAYKYNVYASASTKRDWERRGKRNVRKAGNDDFEQDGPRLPGPPDRTLALRRKVLSPLLPVTLKRERTGRMAHRASVVMVYVHATLRGCGLEQSLLKTVKKFGRNAGPSATC